MARVIMVRPDTIGNNIAEWSRDYIDAHCVPNGLKEDRERIYRFAIILIALLTNEPVRDK